MNKENVQIKAKVNISTGVVTFITDEFLTVLSGNNGFYEMIRYSQVQFKILQRNRLINLMNFDVSEEVKCLIKKQLKSGISIHIEMKMSKKDGETAWFYLSGYSIESSGTYNTLSCEIVDITQVKELSKEYLLKSSSLNILINSIPGGVATVCYDDKFTVICANDEYYEIGGYSREESERSLVNYAINLIYPEDRAKVSETIASQISMGNTVNADFRIVKKNGDIAWLTLRANRMADQNKIPVFQCVLIDITQERYYNDELKKAKKEMEMITTSMPGGVFTIMYDAGFEILEASNNYYKMVGYTKEEYYKKFRNKLIYPIHHDDRTKFMETIQEQVLKKEKLNAEYRIIKKDESISWMIFQGNFIGEINKIPMYQCVMIENTTIKAISEETKKVKRELKNVADAIPVGIATLEIGDKVTIIYANESYYTLGGYRKEEREQFSRNYIQEIIHPDDREEFINKLLLQAKSKNKLEAETRLVKKDKSIAWIQVVGNMVPIKSRCIYQCAFIDITNHKMAIMAIEMERDYYRIISEQSNEVIYQYDIQNDYMICSSKYRELYNGDPEIHNFIKTALSRNVIHPSDMEIFKDMVREVNKGEEHYYKELRIKDKNGIYIWNAIEGTSIFENGYAIKSVGKIADIDKQKKEKEELLWSSHHDELTQLYNKNKIQSLIQNIIKNSNNNENHVMLIVAVDNFKVVNDTLGYIFADTILVEAAGAISKLVGEAGVVGRFSGDEFIIFLKNVTSEDMIVQGAKSVCELFRTMYCGENNECNVSSSIGIAVYPRDGTNYYELLNSSYRALQSVKNKGKNNYKFYDSESDFEYNIKKTYGNRIYKDLNKSLLRQSIQSDSLAANIFEILFETKDIKSGINLSLSIISKKLNICGVSIFEASYEKKLSKFEYEWFENRENFDENELVKIATRQFNDYRDFFNEEGLFICNDTQSGQKGNLKECFKTSKVKAVVQCAFYDNDEYRGFVSFYECRKSREWNQNEIESIIVITKMLWAYLVKLHEQEKYKDLVYLDSLTGIPNINKFNIEVKKILDRNELKNYAIVSFDIEKFKFINATYGYEEGNRLLGYVSSIITSLVEEKDMFARVSADNFVVLLKCDDKDKLLKRLVEVNNKIQYIASNNEKKYRVVLTCGIYVIQLQDKDVTIMIDRANIARKTVKGSYESSFAFYSEIVHSQIVKEIEIENIMVEALKNKEFEIYMQPKVRLDSKAIVGAEALVRWIRLEGKLIEPNYFIPIFEKNGFIVDLDFFVFEQVHRKIRQWLDEERTVLPISINLSRVHLRDEKFIDRLLELSEKYGIPTSLIEIELTESSFTDNIQNLLVYMHRLKKLGYKISIDDFGAGYSSLNLLKDLPVDILKIDSEFFRSNSDKKREKIIIESIVEMSKKLGITVLTEGVETEEQSVFLESIGCDLAQGFLFAKPMPMEEFEEIL